MNVRSHIEYAQFQENRDLTASPKRIQYSWAIVVKVDPPDLWLCFGF
jgi:hypothetical protein